MTEPEHGLSPRLLRFIEAYNVDGNVMMREINHDIWQPVYRGLAEEFEAAVLGERFDTDNWGVCYNGGLYETDTRYVDGDVRLFWKAIFPGRPFPVGDPELPMTPTFPDRDTRFWTEDGIEPPKPHRRTPVDESGDASG
ncbi:hypothetical protein Afil01_51090 [Actinorhabdospora filicis]|uniref:Uncharacterized protein n=1 Tax=Actinorhabdospora filicis TaxID=1785913 RepID=A0A9W6W5E7_9ACTN|nr:hypothetical protein [Actinorhabdospora filicis]GLZ80302.1 hypothetical protein Afil01_51090 [Actinorhabdospora filicis]